MLTDILPFDKIIAVAKVMLQRCHFLSGIVQTSVTYIS